MKATELRIGNLLHYRDKSSIVEVSNIGSYGFETINKYGFLYGSDDVNDYNPIPLTEEWLLKFGWVWNEECKSYECKDIRMNLKYESVSNSYTMFNYVIKAMICKRIWYVHQLQNLYFALTGEELKIK